ncbi:MFS transporter [Thermococcus sp. AM4]|uniref:MFS transporter n=1 Tax=Thermococcus sp. (strain AM4) TaxID=246969 RepID=UPI00018707D7|nr:MFS transporter [Thermococcus sp. AM4]EEB73887.1 Multidrug resistance protein [Thermococcus sp. AM4]
MLSGYGRDAKILIGANALGQTFLWFSFFIMPFYLKALGYDMKAMGAFFSVQTIVGGLFFLLAGHVSLHLGYRKTLLLSALIGLIGRLLQVLALNTTVLFLGFVLVGVNMGLRQPNYNAYLSELVPDERRHEAFSKSFGLGTLFNSLGVLLAGFLPGYLMGLSLAEETAYRITFSLSILQFVFVVPALLLVRDVEVREKRIKWERSLVLKILKFSLPSALIGLGAGITIPFMSIYFKLKFGETLQAISWIFFFQQLAMGLGSFGLPELVRRWGPVKVITSFQGTATFLFAIFPSIETFALAGAVYVLRAILMNIIWPIYSSFMMGFFKTEEKATANGIQQAFSTFMRGVGNSIGGTLFAVSLAYPFYATALLYATATAMFYAFFIKHNEE